MRSMHKRAFDFTPRGTFGGDRGLKPMQLDLPYWPRGCLKEALDAYYASLESVTDETLDDYHWRKKWLLAVFGESTKLEHITFELMQDVYRLEGPKGRGLMNVTINKRYDFLWRALRYAVRRKIVRKDDLSEPPKYKDDSKRGKRTLTLAEQRELRLALWERFRDFCDLGFWTGHHSLDLFTMVRSHLEPDYEWKDTDGTVIRRGRYWRRNHKHAQCVDAWLPMESGFREIAKEILSRPGSPQDLIIGKLWNLSDIFKAACDRCAMARVTPNKDLRRSFASMLSARGYSAEYIRQAMAHSGPVKFGEDGNYDGTLKPTIDTRHYMRLTTDLIINEIKRTNAAESAK